jgi:hypothetical protein
MHSPGVHFKKELWIKGRVVVENGKTSTHQQSSNMYTTTRKAMRCDNLLWFNVWVPVDESILTGSDFVVDELMTMTLCWC